MGDLDDLFGQHRIDHRVDGHGGLDIDFDGSDGPHLDHQQFILRTRNEKIERPLFQLIECGVEDELPIFPADAYTRDRAVHRYIGKKQCSRSRIEGQRLQIRLLVDAQKHHGDLDRIEKALGEKRPKGSVDEPGCEGFEIAGFRLALDESSGDSARRIALFDVLDRERKKMLLDRFVVHHGRRENDGLSASQDHGTVRLSGDFARFDRDGSVVHFEFKCTRHCVLSFFISVNCFDFTIFLFKT